MIIETQLFTVTDVSDTCIHVQMQYKNCDQRSSMSGPISVHEELDQIPTFVNHPLVGGALILNIFGKHSRRSLLLVLREGSGGLKYSCASRSAVCLKLWIVDSFQDDLTAVPSNCQVGVANRRVDASSYRTLLSHVFLCPGTYRTLPGSSNADRFL